MVKFLMYRVELKDTFMPTSFMRGLWVPNVPCGVESSLVGEAMEQIKKVPNVPCGVESCEAQKEELLRPQSVPNVPCGVESSQRDGRGFDKHSTFLMYRVELKEPIFGVLVAWEVWFLMYRVELKAQR